ncbi:MAG TPA: phosphopantetheine-binding protein [Burkholderiales bacterium]|nr:phosphopantetheine-binding protein [Burkholderiales bacterium]
MAAVVQSAHFERELADMLVEVLHLEVPASEIDPEAPLFGDRGLGLDSIDILEIAVAISKKYGFKLRSDDPDNDRIFASLRALAAHIAERRSQ